MIIESFLILFNSQRHYDHTLFPQPNPKAIALSSLQPNPMAIALVPLNPTQRRIALSPLNLTQRRSHTLPST
ncbi:MAG: hypothetical protein RLP02_17140 [Coleofasciculus sp. C2-GNP5-27]